MRSIVVGVESTAAAERALDRALLEGLRTGRPVEVVRAWQTPVWVGAAMGQVYDYDVFEAQVSSAEAARLEVDDLVEKALTRLPEKAEVEVRSTVVEGSAGHVLVAASENEALLVVGSRGLSPLAGAVFGSTTAHVLHHTETPVMVVPREGPPPGSFHSVVVGLDGTPASRSALRWAHRAATDHQCPLLLVHAWELASVPGSGHILFNADDQAFDATLRAWLLDEAAEVLQVDDVNVMAMHGDPSRMLVSAVGPDDLLVVGSRGEGFAGLHLGSVSTRCARHSEGVVVVVRSGEERLA
jgi:nucleotide-binding universal stress UspA family protein